MRQVGRGSAGRIDGRLPGIRCQSTLESSHLPDSMHAFNQELAPVAVSRLAPAGGAVSGPDERCADRY